MKIFNTILNNPKKTSIIGVIVMLVFLGIGIVKDWQPLDEPMGMGVSAPSSDGGALVGYWSNG